jgi:hypothetical protein
MTLSFSKTATDLGLHLLMIEIGDISKMIGFTFKIIDFLGKVVYETIIQQPILNLDFKTIGGRGTYYLEVIDDSSQILEIEKVVLR